MPKTIFWDIETQKMIAQTFSLYPEKINHTDIIEDWYIICACWSINDEKKVHSISGLDHIKKFRKDPRDDYEVVKKLHEVLSSADYIVAHYGDKFDWPKLTARIIYHGLSPLPPVIKIDTKKLASRHFNFTSNKLDYLGEYLGVGRKVETTYGLWDKVRLGDEKALKEMVKYNKQDVLLLRDVFNRMKPHVKLPYYNADACPKCGSDKLTKQGVRRSTVSMFQKYQCQDCGSWCQERLAMKIDKPSIVSI